MKKLFALFLLTLPMLANAHIFYKSECEGIAKYVYGVAQLRDDGKPKEEVHALVQQMAAEALGDEDSWVKDDEDVKAILNLIDIIYVRKDLAPEVVGNAIFTSCMASALNGGV